jgi:hypothetical protein
MKNTLILMSFLATAGSVHAQLLLNEAIQVDFGPTVSTGNINNYTAAAPGNIAAGTLVKTTGGTVSNVGLTVGGNIFFSNNDALDTATGTPFGANAQTDWIGVPDGTSFTLTFTGLNPALIYDVVLGGMFFHEGANTRWSVSGAADQTTNSGSATASYVSFTGLGASGGNLTLTGFQINDAAVVSAVQITAIPEPSAALLSGLGLLALLRRRR